jgi:predicted aldo/keto reductase-like oxidoreductase
MTAPRNVNRRRFLRDSILLTGAVTAAAASACRRDRGDADAAAADASPAPVAAMPMRTLGRTGLRVSEIGFGGFPIDDPDVILYALDRGINYVDTSNCYRGGRSEVVVGKALKGRRDRFVVTTKWCPHHVREKPVKRAFLAQLDASLMRLQTDHVDIILNHEVGKNSDDAGVDRLKNPEMFEAFETAKQAGKVRFLGASGHDSDLMSVVDHAIKAGPFDVLLCRYSFLDYPEQQTLIERAHAAGVGVIAMKTLAGAKGADLDRFRDRHVTFKQAALKWVLSNDKVSNLIISIGGTRQVDEYVAAAGRPLTAEDRSILEEYAAEFSTQVCRYSGACLPACPEGVKIADILRFSMYFHEYGQEQRGVESYARLVEAERAAHCLHCAGYCEQACAYDLPIKSLMVRADGALAPHHES